jgi:hypothetical protein
MTILDLLRYETNADLDARAHQHVPLPELVKLANLPSREALFDVLVTYQNFARDRPDPLAGEEGRGRYGRLVQEPPERMVVPTAYRAAVEVTPLSTQDEKARKTSSTFICIMMRASERGPGMFRNVAGALSTMVSVEREAAEMTVGQLLGQLKEEVKSCRTPAVDGCIGTNGHAEGKRANEEGSVEVSPKLLVKVRRAWMSASQSFGFLYRHWKKKTRSRKASIVCA